MNTKIRDLELSDAPKMLIWMNDKSALIGLNAEKFINKTLDDCERFINECNNKENLHYAIANANNEYVGTISLKNINYRELDAELAIVITPTERGKKHSENAIKLLAEIAREKGLRKIYLYVKSDNNIAKKAYERTGFIYQKSIDNGKMDYYELKISEVNYG